MEYPVAAAANGHQRSREYSRAEADPAAHGWRPCRAASWRRRWFSIPHTTGRHTNSPGVRAAQDPNPSYDWASQGSLW